MKSHAKDHGKTLSAKQPHSAKEEKKAQMMANSGGQRPDHAAGRGSNRKRESK